MPGYEPHNWIGLIGLCVIALATVLAAWFGSRGAVHALSAKLGQVDRNVGVVKEQVANDHGDKNLRHDLDRVEEKIDAVADAFKYFQNNGFRSLRNDVGGIREDFGSFRGEMRTELRTERAARVEADEAVLQEIRQEIRKSHG